MSEQGYPDDAARLRQGRDLAEAEGRELPQDVHWARLDEREVMARLARARELAALWQRVDETPWPLRWAAWVIAAIRTRATRMQWERR
jgi:hypothetical protein